MSLDRYVGRIVAGSWCASLLFFVGLYVLVDLLNNVAKYLDRVEDIQKVAATATGLPPPGTVAGLLGLVEFLAGHYAVQLPSLFVTIAPFVTVIACMFAVARLMGANEVVPMLFVGRSMFRVLRPVLITGTLAALAMGACWQFVMPTVRESVEDTDDVTGSARAPRSVLLELREGSLQHRLCAGRFLHVGGKPTLQKVILLQENVAGPVQLLTADEATWDTERRDWRLQRGLLRRADESSATIDWLDAGMFTPERIWQSGRDSIDTDLLAYHELVDLRRQRPQRSDVTLALHRHVTFPLANLVLLLLALPFAVWFERGSRVERIIAAVAICGAYLVVDLICQSLCKQSLMHPIVAAWTPTILFGSLGAVMFGSIRT